MSRSLKIKGGRSVGRRCFSSRLRPAFGRASCAKALARHLVSAGLPRIRFHDLRHGYGSLLGDQNEPLSEIRDALRHGSIQTTMRYVHPTRAKQERAIRVDQVLFGARINPDPA
ncbi:MAG: tyrosine-type recombinase/integrase, partial [Dehalococcoidia bacterium]|nr:tyrosine-type recombinase/integrase [Dehalococcoidia bacterium]